MRFLAYSCTHHPLQDEEAIGFLLSQIEDHKPDFVVNLGDIFEAQAASRWPKEYTWALKYEFEVANNYLNKVRMTAEAVNPDVECVWLPGNHDDNIQSLNRIASDLRGLCNPMDHVAELRNKFWKVPTRYVHDRELGCYRLGQVTFAHGFEHSVNSDESQAIKLGIPYGLFVSGHTHRPVVVTRARKTQKVPLPYWYANPGCMRTMCPEYVQRMDHSQWGQAVVIGECETWRYADSFIPTKPLWDAETRVFRMAEGYSPEQPDWRLPLGDA